MNEPVIALHGLPGVGKDTLAQQLVFEYAGATQFAFADALYEDLAEMFDTSVEQLRERDWKIHPQDALALWRCGNPDYRRWLHQTQGIHAMDALTSRFHLQRYGTDYIQGKEGVDYWARRLRYELDVHAQEHPYPIVVSDLRRMGHSFHELDMLRGWAKQHGRPLVVVHVLRDGTTTTGHSSDEVFPPSAFDLVVHNVEGNPSAMFQAVKNHLDH